jgi:hypothetical protein
MMKRELRFLLLAIYHFHIGVIVVALRRGRRAAVRYMKEIHRASKLNAGAYLPIRSVEDVVQKPVEFRVFRPDAWICSMTVSEISTLCYLVASKAPKKILEIGSYRGLTTLNLALNAPQAEVHTVDITDTWGSYYYAEHTEVKNISQHYGDSTNFDFFHKIGVGVDLCLIDGGHSYDQVRNDTVKVLPLMSDDDGRNDFLADVESFRVSQFIHEIKASGIGILQGTGLAFLQLDSETKQKLFGLLNLSVQEKTSQNSDVVAV